MTVYKPLKRLAGRAAELAVELARRRPVVARGGVDNGFKVVPTVEEDVVAVDARNLRDTVIRDGFHSPESLPVGGQ
jgi:D-xylose transport system substrate-binding protein